MPPPSKEKTRSVADFAGFLRALSQEGFEYVVIGGCAVGAYAHLRGESVLTADLDIYASPESLDEILAWAQRNHATILKRPQPRSIPTAFLVWEDKENNILTYSHGLPAPDEAIELGRVFQIKSEGNLEIPIADCYQLLENKLAVNRPKDKPHIELLLRFIEEEIVSAFEVEAAQRDRLAPARRLLKITKSRTLPESLAARLLPLARTAPDLRFLANTVPTAAQGRALLAKAQGDQDLAAKIEEIFKLRELLPGG